MVKHIQYKFHEIPSIGYLVMAPDGMDDGHHQTFFLLSLSPDKSLPEAILYRSGEKNILTAV